MKIGWSLERGLIAFFALLLIYFSFFQQDTQTALQASIPPEAQILVDKTNVRAFLESPISHRLNESLGQPIQSLVGSSSLLDLFHDRELLLAELPHTYSGNDKRWLILVHLPQRALWLRWKMQLFPPDAFEYVGTFATLPIWKFTVGSPNSTETFYLTFSESLLIACHSHHIDDMKRIIYFAN